MGKHQGPDEGSAQREKILAAGLAAQVKRIGKSGGDVDAALRSLDGRTRTEVVETLSRDKKFRW
jgi:hypothetical protein